MSQRTVGWVFGCAAVIAVALAIRFTQGRTGRAGAIEHFHRSDELQRTGHFDAAVSEAKEAIALDPTYYPVRQHLSDMYDSVGRLADAAAVLEEGANADPPRAERYCTALAELFDVNRDYPRAVSYMSQAHELDRGSEYVERRLAMFCEHARDLAHARSVWLDYAKRHPGSFFIARGLARLRKLEAAASRQRRANALRSSPNILSAKSNTKPDRTEDGRSHGEP